MAENNDEVGPELRRRQPSSSPSVSKLVVIGAKDTIEQRNSIDRIGRLRSWSRSDCLRIAYRDFVERYGEEKDQVNTPRLTGFVLREVAEQGETPEDALTIGKPVVNGQQQERAEGENQGWSNRGPDEPLENIVRKGIYPPGIILNAKRKR